MKTIQQIQKEIDVFIELLENKPNLWMVGKGGCYIEGESISYGIPYYFGVSRNYMSRPSGYIITKE